VEANKPREALGAPFATAPTTSAVLVMSPLVSRNVKPKERL